MNAEQQDEVRVHDCLYDGCFKRTEECKRCDAVYAIIKEAAMKKQMEKSK